MILKKNELIIQGKNILTELDGKAPAPNEGVWSPIYYASVGEWDGAISSGEYYKIGKMVFCQFVLRGGRGTLEGSIFIDGLPFSASQSRAGLVIGDARRFETNIPNLRGRVTGTRISLIKGDTNTSTNQLQHTDLRTSTGNQNWLEGSIKYLTDE